MERILEKAAKIKLVILDVDGVLTDGNLYYTDSAIDFKAFHVHDGLGIKLLQESGIEIAIITSHQSPLITRRMTALGIQHVFQGQQHKLAAYQQLLAQLQFTDASVCYVGDDLPDLSLIRRAGLGIAVANAVPFVREHADWQTTERGGHGAVREVCELIMRAQNTWQVIHDQYL
jgi:3-deoxy-D-manno-octulosonate 8-phosphate phosphatase (KDO 8-P phosphatase)